MNVYMIDFFLRWCMTIAILSCVFAGIGLICTLLGCVINLSVKIGRVLANIETMEEDQDRNREKFQELYVFKSNTEKAVARIETELSQVISPGIQEIKDDIRRLISDKAK